MRLLRAAWRDPVNRRAARVAAIAGLAGMAIFLAAALPAALRSSDRVAAATDDQLTQILRQEASAPGTIAAQTAGRWRGGRALLWFVSDGGVVRSLDGASAPVLPGDLAGVAEPRTAEIGGVAFRVAGATVAGGRIVGAVVPVAGVEAADAQLAAALAAEARRRAVGPRGLERPPPPAPMRELAWMVAADGTVTPLTGTGTPDLPPLLGRAGRPATYLIDGAAYRVAGAAVAGGRVVVAIPNVLPAESAVRDQLPFVPLVGLTVFGVAFAIGRWAAAPIEDARRRQLAFTADASHELRTPLAVIEAEASLALSRPRDAPGYREALERVLAESHRLGHLVADLLWLARFDASPPGPAEALVDVCAAAAAAVDRFRPVAASRGQALRMGSPPCPEAWIAAPTEWLDRLLGVLLDNACRHSPAGGPIEVRVDASGGHVRLTVDDGGPGIPEAERRLVFDRFHRSTDRPGGTGLGLAIGDAVVRGTRGRWEIGRSPFGGASMRVAWPAAGFTVP